MSPPDLDFPPENEESVKEKENILRSFCETRRADFLVDQNQPFPFSQEGVHST